MPGLSQSTRLATPGGHSDGATIRHSAPSGDTRAVLSAVAAGRLVAFPRRAPPSVGDHGAYRLRTVNRPVGAVLLPVAVPLLSWVGVADRVVS